MGPPDVVLSINERTMKVIALFLPKQWTSWSISSDNISIFSFNTCLRVSD